MHRSASTRNIAILAVCLVELIAGYLVFLADFRAKPAVAQEERAVTVEVAFRPTSEESVGERCGYLDVLTDVWPHSKQVIVRDAAGVIIGTVDLLDVFNPVVVPAPEEALPGIVNDEELCVVTSTVPVPDSVFYTFTIEDHYDWTVSRSTLERRDWSMRVEFFTDN